MSDLEKNQNLFGEQEEDGLRPYSEILPYWDELPVGTKAMLNDIDDILPPYMPTLAQMMEEVKEERRKAKEKT